jgi:hypothetical protein
MKLHLSLLLFIWISPAVRAFVVPQGIQPTDSSHVRLMMAVGKGMGMGMGATKTPKNKNGKKGGAKTSSSFNVNASMLRLEKQYDEIMLASAKQLAKKDKEEDPRWASDTNDNKITREYVVAARAATKQGGIRDWVPIAQLCLARPENEYDDTSSEEIIQNVISSYCRELSYVAAFGAPVFSKVARNDVQYSVEPMDSFQKFVYDSVVKGGSDQDISKAEARKTLGLEKTNDDAMIEKSAIKQAYRQMSFQLHPDRFEGTPEECEEAKERFARVKLSYETLNSGVRADDGSSWYESLGGRARTEFVGPVNLLPLAVAEEQMERKKVEGALCGLDRDLIQSFVARNLRSE